eukprot:2562279-Pyramimonas_sp.AAC.1
MRGNLLIDNIPEDQQRPPQQLDVRAPARLLQKNMRHVAALHQVGHTGRDQGVLPPRDALRSSLLPRHRCQEQCPGIRLPSPTTSRRRSTRTSIS